MAAATLTVTGNIATKVARERKKDTGEPWVHFRIACNERRYDSRTGTWLDGEPSFYTVVCWQSQLAKNADASLKKGDPVIVHGKVKVREWRDDNNVQRYTTEITATSIGHDLFRGVSAFHKNLRASQSSPDAEEVKEKLSTYVVDANGVDRASGEVVPALASTDDSEWAERNAAGWATPEADDATLGAGVNSAEPGAGAAPQSGPDEESESGDDESGELAGVGLAA
ncbi:single-stranded DNA-binding protein [Phytoactinopolyspora mesophila]|uniref:Single-stranded DNA-binding protein n=1 Tax=Phytoactinopolyspora mesophila TaxID=2650750 RepID=A0A7K3M6N8_9ACTN|nr:single-stranded DNA-binding protein [Phytoactinopolyspora mesophila]NDL58984.1 single-stranded DNA-binding protein [Phytoactinopolyspora mesophila]